jgi:hypothetical protein
MCCPRPQNHQSWAAWQEVMTTLFNQFVRKSDVGSFVEGCVCSCCRAFLLLSSLMILLFIARHVERIELGDTNGYIGGSSKQHCH